MEAKKYPIGTRVRYVESDPTHAASKDIGKIGKIVGYHEHDWPIIFLPKSEHISRYSESSKLASWATGWESIEILSQKNQQLLFDFAYEEG